ncbi:hypothetical protein AU255_01980 [Methyloprofundus sedimenti]|uniref:Glycosyltransferase 2-like domain-containing protein n=1 Tax=Methyloprofundus sedimenti TaxID=1420851 RepID=A0A1V8M571_9GAMM|nr:glycosyltransferase [Methyloprofundus sedimenti]OQK16699.1 hypothetical protein AU255_01980 [Methyloprofundus sedimenti]
MQKQRWGKRLLRKLMHVIPGVCLTARSTWQWLRYYPAVTPAAQCFTLWNQTDGCPDYQQWVNQHSLQSLNDWRLLKQQAYQWQLPPKISIVTPVYNTQPDVLYECIISIRAQAYPYWQLTLVDDGSSNAETHRLLASAVCNDPRIKVCFCAKTQGISRATNLGIEKSTGDYVIFLDHDDRLSLDALFYVAEEIQQHPEVDIVYSDRDMISPKGKRYMHLFKPDWSPETLLSGNYIFHLMCYRRSLLNQLQGYRPELDGSQDYDLILRAIETQPNVRHIQKVLYHWRQYQGSVSLDSSAKDYAFKAGVYALNQALQRRGIAGVASEIKSLWRGNYQLDLVSPDLHEIEVINIASDIGADAYAVFINQSVQQAHTGKPFIALLSETLTPVTDNALCHLAAWLKMDGVGLASGSIISDKNCLDYVGATYKKDASLLRPYQGSLVDETGYMAISRLARNISAPHPYCVLIRRDLWQQLNGLNSDYQGYYALLDFALRALAINWRCVSVPQAQFIRLGHDLLNHFPEQDKQLFFQHWQHWLKQGDPYYNKNLNRENPDKLYYIA